MKSEIEEGAGNSADDAQDLLNKAFDDALSTVESGDDTEELAATTEADSTVDGGDQEAAEAAPDEVEGDDLVEQDIDAEPSEETVEDEPLDAPGHWPKDLRDEFSALSKEAQEILIKRDKAWESQTTRKSMELSEKSKFADAVSGLFDEQQRQAMRLSGLDEVGVLGQIVEANKLLATDPKKFMEWAARNYNVDFKGLLAEPDELSFLDEPVRQENTLTPDEVNDLVSQRVAQEQLNVMVTQFATSQDESGNPKYPHFENLKASMGLVMQTDPNIASMPDGVQKLERAYEAAMFLDPALRQEAIERQVAQETEQKKRSETAAKAQKAKSPVKVKSPTGKKEVKPTGLDDMLTDAMDGAGLV